MLKNKSVLIQIISCGVLLGLLIGVLTYPPIAQAKLDELIRIDVPYLTATEPVREPKPSVVKQDNLTVASAEPQTYIVCSGDTLSSIAQKYRTSQTQLMEINHLPSPNHILVGQVLKLPGGTLPYVVKKGDCLDRIAARFGVTPRELVELNNLSDENCLWVGQHLKIPAGQGGGDTTSQVARGLSVGQLSWPVKGWISSPFGLRDGKMHHGVDIAADQGQIVRAVKDGRVIFSGVRGDYGNAVILDHGDGVRTLYAHNSSLLVQPGQKVTTGQPIARVGSTGRSTGPHVHLEVIVNGVHIDPLLCLK